MYVKFCVEADLPLHFFLTPRPWGTFREKHSLEDKFDVSVLDFVEMMLS